METQAAFFQRLWITSIHVRIAVLCGQWAIDAIDHFKKGKQPSSNMFESKARSHVSMFNHAISTEFRKEIRPILRCCCPVPSRSFPLHLGSSGKLMEGVEGSASTPSNSNSPATTIDSSTARHGNSTGAHHFQEVRWSNLTLASRKSRDQWRGASIMLETQGLHMPVF